MWKLSKLYVKETDETYHFLLNLERSQKTERKNKNVRHSYSLPHQRTYFIIEPKKAFFCHECYFFFVCVLFFIKMNHK